MPNYILKLIIDFFKNDMAFLKKLPPGMFKSFLFLIILYYA